MNQSLGREEMPDHLRTRIWNVFYGNTFEFMDSNVHDDISPTSCDFADLLWDKFFKGDQQSFVYMLPANRIKNIKERFFQLEWHEVYDFIEFFAAHWADPARLRILVLHLLNQVFGQERVPYRIIDNTVTPLTSEEEVREVEQALGLPEKFKPVCNHLEKALDHYSDKKDPDYKNSIKESICAVESLVQILLGKKGTLGDLIKKLSIHPAMKEGFDRLYGWTSDEGGIRHGKFNEELSAGEPEARYMLVTCSAFINYVIAKLDASGKT